MTHPRIDSLVLIRQQRWRVARITAAGPSHLVSVTGVGSRNRGVRATFVLPFDICEQIPTVQWPKRVTARGWRRLARRALADATPSPHSLRTAVHARFDPLPFQLEPALAYLRGECARLLIADAVGLGKTVQAGLLIAEMLARRPGGKALIVVPSGLREQWHDEMRDRFAISVDVLDAPGIWRATLALPVGTNPWSVVRVGVTSIDFVKRPDILRSLEPLVWDLVVFDEAHTLTGRSDRHAAAAGLAARARAVVLLTATPHDGDPEGFQRLCQLGDLRETFPLTVFRRTRATLSHPRRRRSVWFRLRPVSAEQQMHGALLAYVQRVWREATDRAPRLAMLVLLKRGASSAAALARSLERRRAFLNTFSPSTPDVQLSLPLPTSQDDEEPGVELGCPGLQERQDELAMLDGLLATTRMVTGDERKILMLRRLLHRTGETAIIFTQYRDTLDGLSASLGEVRFASIHGGMSLVERAAAAHAFTSGAVRVLLATDAASEGLNLQSRCRLVVSFDVPWSPTRLEQRVGRVDRIGQQRPVHAWQMVASGTYEEHVAAQVASRARIASDTLTELGAEDERQLAEALATGVPLSPREPMPPPSETIPSRTGLVAAAEREAQRIAVARRMLSHAARVLPDRACQAILGTHADPFCILAFKVTFADGAGEHLWEGIAGMLADAPADRQVVAQLLTSTRIVSLIGPHVEGHLREELRLLRHVAAKVLERDRAIARVLRADRARLSALLVQPDLFTRRLEQRLAPQLQLLDESMTRLRRASREMCRIRGLHIQSVTPLLGAILSR